MRLTESKDMNLLAVWWIQEHQPEALVMGGVVLMVVFALACVVRAAEALRDLLRRWQARR
jgi:hypothetical protein